MADPTGQVVETPDLGQGDASPDNGQVNAAPFYKYEDQEFKSPDELTKYIREGTYRHSDYTKKTQSLAEERKKWENERSSFYKQVSDFGEQRKGWEKYEQLDKRMKSDPAFARAVLKAVQETQGQGLQGQDMQEVFKNLLEETGITKKLSDFEEAEKRRQADTERDQALEELSSRYPDLDRKGVVTLYEEIMGPDKRMGDFLELLHFAHKGRSTNPEAIQKKTIESLEKKKDAGIPTSGGASYSGEKKTSEGNIRRLAEKLKAGAKD